MFWKGFFCIYAVQQTAHVCGRAAAAAAVMRWDGCRSRHCRVEALLPLLLRVTLIMDLHQHLHGDAENARHENARNAIVWNTACCICLSIAEQECI